MSKLTVGVMFGGHSVEHQVSVITGLQVIENIDKSKYDPIPIFVSKEGDWYTGEELLDIKNYKNLVGLLSNAKKVFLPPIPSMGYLYFYPIKTGFFKKEAEYIKLDAIFPAFHGMHGEDGTMQGLFELANVPYVGCGVTGSAVGMDKIIMKDIFKANGLPTINYTWFLRKEYEGNKDKVISDIEASLKYPMFVKPANLGSSIGINKAHNKGELASAIEVAIHYDRRIIVEQGLENMVEINCSVLGSDEDLLASVCEQPVSWQEFLSFDDKYMRGSSSKGMKTAGMTSTTRNVPAPIPEEKSQEIKNLAKEVFKVLDCSGVSRIDFMLRKDDMQVFVNEINTIPGSMAFYLWEYENISFKELIDRLIQIALKNHKEHNKNMYVFDTELLLKASSGGTKNSTKR